MTDFRALCAELADELTQFNAWYIEDNGYGLPNLEALLRRCDAALAEPKPEEPTDEGLMEVFWDHQNGMEELWADDWPAAARAVLARWGNLPESPDSSDEPAVPEGREPASVTEQPSDEALYDYWISTSPEFGCADPVGFARAVLARWGTPDLAETRSSLGDAPQLVPVSERLPEPGDCSSDGKCWWFCFECPGEHSYWIFAKEVYCAPTYWLPAHALPLPTAND